MTLDELTTLEAAAAMVDVKLETFIDTDGQYLVSFPREGWRLLSFEHAMYKLKYLSGYYNGRLHSE